MASTQTCSSFRVFFLTAGTIYSSWVLLAVPSLLEMIEAPHFHGGESLLQIGIKFYGRSTIEYTMGDGSGETLNQFALAPGNVYAGNRFAVKHQVLHDTDAREANF